MILQNLFPTVIKATGTNEMKVLYLFYEVNSLEMYDLISRPAPWVLGMWLWWRSGNDSSLQMCFANTSENY